MDSGEIPILARLSDSDHAIPAAEEDIRCRKVTDRSGNELGKVGDLIIDEEEHKVRFLLLEHGGFLGVRKEKSCRRTSERAPPRTDESAPFLMR